MNKHPNQSARRPLSEEGDGRGDTPNPSPMKWHEPSKESITPAQHEIPRRKKPLLE